MMSCLTVDSATIYVKDDPNNSGTKICYKSAGWPDATCSDGTGNTTLTASHTAAGANGSLIIAAGTYVGTQLGAAGTFATGAAGITTRSASTLLDSGVAGWNSAYAGAVTLNGNNASALTLRVLHDDSTFNGLGITCPGAAYAAVTIAKTRATFNDLSISLGNGSTSSWGIDGTCAAECTAVFNRLVISGQNAWVTASGANTNYSPTFNYSKFIGVGSTTYNRAAIFNNCLWAGNSVGPVMKTSGNTGQAVTFNNPILIANSLTNASQHILNNAYDQTWVINNGILQGNPIANDNYNFSGVTINNSVRDKDPLFIQGKYSAIFAFIIDDVSTSGTLDWVHDTVGPALVAHGMRGTFAVYMTPGMSQDMITKLLALEAASHEIAVHTRSHTAVGTLASPYTIAKAGYTCELASGVLTCTNGSPISFTLADYTVSSLKTALTAAGYTMNGDGGGWYTAPATVLKDIPAGTSINSAYSILVDDTLGRAWVIDGCWQDLTDAGLHPTSFVCPYDDTSAGLQTYLYNSGKFLGARGTVNSSGLLSSINAYAMRGISYTYFSDYNACTTSGETTANCIKRNVASFIQYMRITGSVISFYAHGANEWDADQWNAMLDAVQQSQMPVMTLGQIGTYVKTYDPSGDLATTDSMTYTRTMVDSSDYHLKSGSPAVNAGVDVGLTRDYAGKSIVGKPEIGLYERASKSFF